MEKNFLDLLHSEKKEAKTETPASFSIEIPEHQILYTVVKTPTVEKEDQSREEVMPFT